MNKIKIHLENCYGIKSLDTTFDFTQEKAQLIYAGNGVMKSSFAKVFTDLINDKVPKDNFFPNRISNWSITDEYDTPIEPKSIFVIDPPQKKYNCKRVSTLLVNEKLKSEYELLNQEYSDLKENYLNILKRTSKYKGNIELEIASCFDLELNDSFKLFEDFYEAIVKTEDPGLSNIVYTEIFNTQVEKFLETGNFKNQIVEYVEKFNELISHSKYFKPEFNHLNASEVSSSLKNNKFFDVKNQVILEVDGQQQLVNSAADLERLFKEEKEKILNNPELVDIFSALDGALNKNVDVKKFRSFINENKEIVTELADLKELKKKLWTSYAYPEINELKNLFELGKLSSKRVESIIEIARVESTTWRKVVDEFNRRFSLPYTLDVDNQHKVLLNDATPSIVYTYIDGEEKETVQEETLEESISTGERKAWYLLNIIFEIEVRKNDDKNCLLIIDDIADSFDYKNKFAIIEYIKEIVETKKFHTIILSHNFDFFRTVSSRLNVHRKACFMPVRTQSGIKLEQAGYYENPLLHWKKNYKDKKCFIAMISMARNLVEYSEGQECAAYITLTSLLHIKENSYKITANDVIKCFSVVFRPMESFEHDFRILDTIFEISNELLEDKSTDINLENKIVLSIAIRLKSEIFIKNKIKDGAIIFTEKNQARELLNIFKEEFPKEINSIRVLDRVALMTPENIHLNSFMYEPLMDLSDHQLKELYMSVSLLT